MNKQTVHALPGLENQNLQLCCKCWKAYTAVTIHYLNKQYCYQLIRCSSSVAANYSASQRAKSTADFINKLKIVEEEADESVLFLKLLKEFNPAFQHQLEELIAEGTELLKIIVASIKKTRLNTSENFHS
ncbi:four helix bundle protein [Aridibaculum aurantiacum]|uniref:four helix bundle protein n=1 Tax=Aridibaculum aurantiacum TaxID=2810307 RepID=UPI001A971012|nr:four helix bundle protein [Aridibaculum aurantiacum]